MSTEIHKLISSEIVGMQLAHAFKKAKSAGLKFRVCKYDGVPMLYSVNDDLKRLNVEVVSGVVRSVRFG
jgi:predicted peroxiredoxin